MHDCIFINHRLFVASFNNHAVNEAKFYQGTLYHIGDITNEVICISGDSDYFTRIKTTIYYFTDRRNVKLYSLIQPNHPLYPYYLKLKLKSQ